jgi:hypothetical protein
MGGGGGAGAAAPPPVCAGQAAMDTAAFSVAPLAWGASNRGRRPLHASIHRVAVLSSPGSGLPSGGGEQGTRRAAVSKQGTPPRGPQSRAEHAQPSISRRSTTAREAPSPSTVHLCRRQAYLQAPLSAHPLFDVVVFSEWHAWQLWFTAS